MEQVLTFLDSLQIDATDLELTLRTLFQALLLGSSAVFSGSKVDEMFNFFQARNIRAAIVLGEFGEVLGIVTVYDVLSFLFGEIAGTLKGADELVEDENGFLVPGHMRLMDFHDLTNIDIDDPVMATIGGMVFRLFGRLPAEGEMVQHEGYDFRVLDFLLGVEKSTPTPV